MTSRIYLLLCLLLCVAGCARRSYPSHDKDAGAPLFGGGGPASLPISFLVKPDAGTQQIVCSADGGCVYVECDAGEVFMRIDGSASRCTQISSGGSFPIVPGAIIYEPGGVSSGNVCATEACVAATVNAAPGPAVYIDCTLGNATITNTQWNFGGYGGLTSIGNTCTLAVSGTGQLQNLLQIVGVEIINNKTSGGPVLSNSLPGQPTVTLASKSELITGSTATEPFWALSSGSMGVIFQGGSGFGTNNPSQAVVALTGSAALYVSAYQLIPNVPIISSMVSGTSGTSLTFYGDTSAFPFVTQSLFSGTVTLEPNAATTGVNGLYYDASSNVVGGSPLSIGLPPYTFSTGAQPTGVGEVLQITASGPIVKFAPLNATTANSLVGCDAGEVPTGRDGGVGFYCGGGGATYTGTAPIVVSGSAISISAATTSAAGSIELANDLAGTGASPVVQGAQSGLLDFEATTGLIAVGATATTPGLYVFPTTGTVAKDMWLSSQSTNNSSATHPGNTNLYAGTCNGCSPTSGGNFNFYSGDPEASPTLIMSLGTGAGTDLAGQFVCSSSAASCGMYANGGVETMSLTSAAGIIQEVNTGTTTGEVEIGPTGVTTLWGNSGSAELVLSSAGGAVLSSDSGSASLTLSTAGAATLNLVSSKTFTVTGSATPLTVTDSSSLTTSITGSSISNGRFVIEPIPSFTSTDTGLFLGPATVTPSATNYSVDGNATGVYLNGPTTTGQVTLSVAGTVLWEGTGVTTNYEVVAPTGTNVGIGSLTAAGNSTGTNLLAITHGSINTACAGDVCLSAIGNGGLAALSNHGFSTLVAPDLSGTVNTQHATYSRPPLCVASLSSAGTTTCTIPKIASTGIGITYRCMGRTTTAGATGSVGDTTAIVSAATEGTCSTTSGGTTTCTAGTTTTTNTGTANLTTCVLSSVSNVPTVTLTAATDVGIAIDTTIQIEGLYN